MADLFENDNVKTYKKGTILLAQGERCISAYKVKKGCLKSYVIDRNGKEHILQFSPEGWLVADINSFIYGGPSALFIDAIEDSDVLVFDKRLLNTEHVPPEALIQLVTTLTNNIIAGQKRLIALLSATAEERYADFIQTYPTLVQRLPLKLISAYIGITPEYLSEIRNKSRHKGV